MTLNTVEHLALWGPPVLMLFLTFAYYFRWGKEAEQRTTETTGSGGGQ